MNRFTKIGVGGTILAAICCFTPVLPFVMAAVGLGGAVGYVWRDEVFYPIIAGFIILTAIGLARMRKNRENDAD